MDPYFEVMHDAWWICMRNCIYNGDKWIFHSFATLNIKCIQHKMIIYEICLLRLHFIVVYGWFPIFICVLGLSISLFKFCAWEHNYAFPYHVIWAFFLPRETFDWMLDVIEFILWQRAQIIERQSTKKRIDSLDLVYIHAMYVFRRARLIMREICTMCNVYIPLLAYTSFLFFFFFFLFSSLCYFCLALIQYQRILS